MMPGPARPNRRSFSRLSLLLWGMYCGSLLNSQLLIGAEASHPFSVQDLVVMDRISDPRLSPDGTRLAFVVRSTDMESDRGRTDLWLINLDGSGLRRLTSHLENDYNPCWDLSGSSIWFLSTRSGSPQVWRIPVDGGEAVQITDLSLDVGNLVMTPSGQRLLFTLEVFPDCGDLECTQKRLEERSTGRTSGILFDRLFVRHWDQWKDGRRSHLFSMPAAGGVAVDLMAGLDADCPSKPFGGTEEIAVSPDSSVAVFAARVAGSSEAWSTDFDLYQAPLDGSAAATIVTDANRAWDTAPTFSPDGKTLAYLAMKRPGFEADRFRIVLRPWPSGEPTILTESWDRSPSSIAWSRDGKRLLAVADDLGNTALFSVEAMSGEVKKLIGSGSCSSPVSAAGRIVFGLDHLSAPLDLYSIADDGDGLEQITRFNRERLEMVRFGEAEQFSFSGWNNERVYGWVVKPVDFDPARKYPVAFLIHGGPQGSFGNHFHYRWNPQTYAGAGYAAVMVDFHGSTGYGQAFTDSISGDWGGKPLEDLQKGLEAALSQYSWMDEDRVGALGASYGGYMINWIAGAWPDRFRCLVNHDGTFDQRSMYFTTEELWFPEWEHGGTYWDVPAEHEAHNPVSLVTRWKTPMLVIHGALDFRVPLDQGIATFTALQRRGIPSQFLFFPNENHWVLKPHNSILWHESVKRWLDRWLR